MSDGEWTQCLTYAKSGYILPKTVKKRNSVKANAIVSKCVDFLIENGIRTAESTIVLKSDKSEEVQLPKINRIHTINKLTEMFNNVNCEEAVIDVNEKKNLKSSRANPISLRESTEINC